MPSCQPGGLSRPLVELPPYLRSVSVDHGMENGNPLAWEQVTLHPDAAFFALPDDTPGEAAYDPYDTSSGPAPGMAWCVLKELVRM